MPHNYIPWLIPAVFFLIFTIAGILNLKGTPSTFVRRLFWVSIVIFLISLAWPLWHINKAAAVIPFVPAFMFARIFIAVERMMANPQVPQTPEKKND